MPVWKVYTDLFIHVINSYIAAIQLTIQRYYISYLVIADHIILLVNDFIHNTVANSH